MSTIVNEKQVQEENIEVDKTTQFNLRTFLGEVRTEFAKISWPSKEQVTREFFSVILLVSILTGIIFIIDKGLGFVLGFFGRSSLY